MSQQILTKKDFDQLEQLLSINTVTPMETNSTGETRAALTFFQSLAAEVGFETIHFDTPPKTVLNSPLIPVSVKSRHDELRDDFLERQPNLLLRLGGTNNKERTLLFNIHFDTVGGSEKNSRDEEKIVGRGVADAKGLALPILAAVRTLLEENPSIFCNTQILLQCVSGEEGGAMGFSGTKYLSENFPTGKLNVVCEPTGGKYIDSTTASMTLRAEVAGEGATDDEPESGENASVVLGSLANFLCQRLASPLKQQGAKLCISGMHTGEMHNRVYASGYLLINIAYQSIESAEKIRGLVETCFQEFPEEFRKIFARNSFAERTALAVDRILSYTWMKHGLPVLDNRDPEMERLLSNAGIERNDPKRGVRPFTCDAMWLADPEAYTVVFGPGQLGANRAHAEGEFLTIESLQTYTKSLQHLMATFAKQASHPEREQEYSSLRTASDSSSQLRISSSELARFYEQILIRAGASRENAAIGAAGLIYADERGIDTHGVANLERVYLQGVENGEIQPQSSPSIQSTKGACAVISGEESLGFVSGTFAMETALSLSEQSGIGCAGVHSSTHGGSYGFYTKIAADRGYIGLALTNLGTQGILPPLGGWTPSLGTNVLAVAAPSDGDVDFSLDMSTAVVSSGRIREYARQGRNLPVGWITGRNGNTVLNPEAYLHGEARLNFLGATKDGGGHKGYGLAVMIDILCGALLGAGLGTDCHELEQSEQQLHLRGKRNIGHLFIAINPEFFAGGREMKQRIKTMLQRLCSVEHLDSSDRVLFPGLPEYKTRCQRLKHGIPVDEGTYETLNLLGQKYEVHPPQILSSSSHLQSHSV